MIRAFIAIEIPSSIRTLIQDQIELLKDAIPPGLIRWVRADSVHLTLKFLGDVDSEQLDPIRSQMQSVADSHEAFNFRVGSLGCFPNLRRPRVLWIGVQEQLGTLAHLQSDLEQVMERIGFERESRAFHPHLTLGRVKRRLGRGEVEKISEALEMMKDDFLGEVEVEELSLMRSDLRPMGAVYKHLAAAKLGVKE